MPRGDGTGPEGKGSMTGRAAGYCAGFNRPGVMNNGPGKNFAPRNSGNVSRPAGSRRGRPGRGMGRRCRK